MGINIAYLVKRREELQPRRISGLYRRYFIIIICTRLRICIRTRTCIRI